MSEKPTYEELEQKVKELEQAVCGEKRVEGEAIGWKNRYESITTDCMCLYSESRKWDIVLYNIFEVAAYGKDYNG